MYGRAVPRRSRFAIAALAQALLAGLAAGQYQWQAVPGVHQLLPRSGPALAYDSQRGRIVLYGGSGANGCLPETWEWDGTRWERKSPVHAPGVCATSMAYDSRRGRTVFWSAGTWEWDGTDWALRNPPTQPPAMSDHALAYDTTRGVTVLFGNSSNSSHTWEWDGTFWVQRTPAHQPSTRYRPALAYDESRGVTVLYGGMPAGTYDPTTETWEWDGNDWAQRFPMTNPGRRARHAMAYDHARNRILLFGGVLDGALPVPMVMAAGAWEWDGTNWSEASPSGGRVDPALAGHAARGCVLLVGGLVPGTVGSPFPLMVSVADSTCWAGGGWSGWFDPAPNVYRRSVVHDPVRGRTLLFGGGSGVYLRSETWEWGGTSWLGLAYGFDPGARDGTALAYDPVRSQGMLFGGYDLLRSLLQRDTRHWDGAAWSLTGAATSPAARSGHAMATDSARQRIVLFGGSFFSTYLTDTWEWTGSDWMLRSSVGPQGREEHVMAYDPGLGRTVLFGGRNGTTPLLDTWEWDGTAWAQRFPRQSPSAATGITLVHDPLRGRTVYTGGGETWEWNGAEWTLRSFQGPSGAGVYDRSRGRTVVFTDPPQELIIACDIAGPGHPTGSRMITCTGTPAPGAVFCVTFASPARQAWLAIGSAPPLRPALTMSAPFCEPALLYTIPWAIVQLVGDPAQACGAFPNEPVLTGQGLCIQGITSELTGCFRATDGVVVTIQP